MTAQNRVSRILCEGAAIVEARIQGVGRTIRAARAVGVFLPRRGGRVRLGVCQRPLPAVEAHRRARAVFVCLAGGARRQDPARPDRHQCRDADLPLSSLGRRPGVRHSRGHVPRPRRARRRDRRVAQRSAGDRHEMAGLQGAAGPAARVDRLDPAAVDRGTRHIRGPVLPHPGGDDLRPPGEAGADLDRRIGSDRGGHGR